MAGFRKAKAEQAALKLGIYGPAGSGKTFTALLVAEGLAKLTGKRIAFVDTERGTDFYCKAVPERKAHPDAFDFDALYTKSLSETLAEVKKLKPDEYGVVVIDSITHLWEAARLAYEGKTTRAGTIPMHAWGSIKKPYKELMNYLLNSAMHVVICGRQGNEYAEDEETDELKCVGVKMKAEGETPYEPHILIRMECKKGKGGQGTVYAFAEKDRTGTIAGKTIANPTFDLLVKPMLPLLGGTQAQQASADEISAQDGEALNAAENERAEISGNWLTEFKSMISLAKSVKELKEIGAAITPERKKEMLPAHVVQVRECYQNRLKEIETGARRLEPVEA